MVLQITEQLKDGRKYTHDLHGLKLPSGDYAYRLDQRDLFRELTAIGVPEIESYMGNQQLLILYSRYLQDGR